jgi:hypothetical protein
MKKEQTLTQEETKTKKIQIWNDQCPINPFEEWDCEPDLMFKSNGPHVTKYGKGDIVDFIREKATEGKIIRHQKAIAEILNLDLDSYEDFTKEEKAGDINYEITYADMDQIEELCELLKIPCKNYTSRGYSQGDWAYVLIVLTDEFFERTGCDRKNSEEILEGTAKLFDQWAWGDVYGFSIVEVTTCNLGCEHEEVTGSCGGFYGTDFENNGMAEHIPEELHEELKNFDTADIKY